MGYVQFPINFKGVAQIQASWEPYCAFEDNIVSMDLGFAVYTVEEPIITKMYKPQVGVAYSNRKFTEDELTLSREYWSASYGAEIKKDSGETLAAKVTKYAVCIHAKDSEIHIQGNTIRFYKAVQILSNYCGVPNQDIDLIKKYFNLIIESFIKHRTNELQGGLQDLIRDLAETAALIHQPYIISYLHS